MANVGVAVLIGAAIALMAASRKKKNGDEAVTEPELDVEGRDTTEPVVADKGVYYGERGVAAWMIFEETDGTFTWVWRLQIQGPEASWPARSGGPAPSQQAAGDDLFDDMEENLGAEGLPGVDNLIEEPPEEGEGPHFDQEPYEPPPPPEPEVTPPERPGGYGS
jgi:hypothetical protein